MNGHHAGSWFTVEADIEAICREAATIAVREYVPGTTEGESRPVEEIEVTGEHFEQALADVDPSQNGKSETTPVGAEP